MVRKEEEKSRIKIRDIFARLDEAIDDFVEKTGKIPKYILIGREEMWKLQERIPGLDYPISYQFSSILKLEEDNGSRYIFRGIEILVIWNKRSFLEVV